MANLTLTIGDGLLRNARIRALEQGTTVNSLVRQYLERFTGVESDRAVRNILRISERSQAGSGPGGRTWTRDELYER